MAVHLPTDPTARAVLHVLNVVQKVDYEHEVPEADVGWQGTVDLIGLVLGMEGAAEAEVTEGKVRDRLHRLLAEQKIEHDRRKRPGQAARDEWRLPL